MKTRNLRLETGYLVEPVSLQGKLAIHQIQITTIGEGGSSRVRISLDPNRCILDSFGEPKKASTRMAPLHLEADVELLEECDEKQLLAIKFLGGQGPAIRLALLPLCATGKEAIVARLLIFGETGEVQAILPMQGASAGCVVA
ncbi:hypothetical protein SOCEGT47_031850 [Sorangium cellulosum]|uniref:Uncharacterized protein n=1 Tax=Sorangium cellulosum TaxID=56 RepID=A0A4P2Q0H2_SORCE|nr:hypothetical protein [Sorangium cellulosum]AUX22679.1 hypothetical protein SOCEGT47_031850 [Sorangium cellulosum]